MSAKVPGDGKLRASIEQGIAECERLAAVFRDAHAAGEGVNEAFLAYKRALRAVYDQMGFKAKNNATIAMSRDAIDSFTRQAEMVTSVDVSAYPRIVKELDPFDGLTRSMLDVCRDRMVDANRIQTAKGSRPSSRPETS